MTSDPSSPTPDPSPKPPIEQKTACQMGACRIGACSPCALTKWVAGAVLLAMIASEFMR